MLKSGSLATVLGVGWLAMASTASAQYIHICSNATIAGQYGFQDSVYFAMVGLQINFKGNMDVLFTLQYLALSSALVVLTVWPVMKIAGHSKMAAWNLSVAMTTRGGPGIVLASLAYSIGIINQRFFVTLILTALVTSLLCGIWFRFVIDRRLELYEGAPAPSGPGDASQDARPAPPREAVVHP